MNWGDISGNSVDHPWSVLAIASVSRRRLTMCSYPEDDKTELVDKVNRFSC